MRGQNARKAALFPPPTQIRIVYLSVFRLAWKILSPFRSIANDFCFTTGAFSLPPHLITFLLTLAQLEINISHRSSMTTATYQTGAQSKLSLEIYMYHSLSMTLRVHFDALLQFMTTNVHFQLSKSRRENGLALQGFRNSSVQRSYDKRLNLPPPTPRPHRKR